VDAVQRAAELAADGARETLVLERVGVATVVRYGLICVLFTLVARALGLAEIGMVEILGAVPGAQLGAILSVTPGAIGFLEGGF
jgi:uncharacterized membrane protein YbhN (UPF0104 family)